MTSARTRKLTLLEGIAAGIFFGTASIFIRFLPTLDVFSIAFWRLIIACAVLAVIIFALKMSRGLGYTWKNLKRLVFLGFFLGLHFIFFISAVKDTTILNATVLVNTTPIFSMFLSSFLFGLKPSRLAVLGIAIAIGGVCIIAYAEAAIAGSISVTTSGTSSLKGDLEAVLAAFFEALYLSYGKKVREQSAILPIMLSIYIFAAITIAALSPFGGGETPQFPTEISLILPLLGLGVLPTAVAHTLYFSSLSNLKSFETATMALLEPVGATVLGIILFNEWPIPIFVVGTALTLAGIVFVSRGKAERLLRNR
ncbi:MAG: DMT family transporter [Candidatus Bathyarchaeia archaeon]